MDKGRAICKVLKDVRQKIATENGISYHPEECHHKGECVGTVLVVRRKSVTLKNN